MLLRGANVLLNGGFTPCDVAVRGGKIAQIAPDILPSGFPLVLDLKDLYLVPGFADVHVHLREPGFSYKETIASGTRAAARGGYTAVCAMPNLDPVPDGPSGLAEQLRIIRKDARVRVYPYGAITQGRKGRGSLSDMAGMARDVIGFSDDGTGVQDESLMRAAMCEAARLGKPIVAHCEDEALLGGKHISETAALRLWNEPGITAASEYAQLARDLRLVAETGCRYHACHLSAAQSVRLMRDAKAQGLPVSCETAPHYLALCDEQIRDEGRFKMNPPIRSRADRDALVEGLKDGAVDVVATDHAPHAEKEKQGGLREGVMGVTGLETAFPVLYTALVLGGKMSLETLIDRMSLAPRRLFGLPGGMRVGEPADLTALDLNAEYAIDSSKFLSMGKATPFEGMRVRGCARLTLVGGEIAWEDMP